MKVVKPIEKINKAEKKVDTYDLLKRSPEFKIPMALYDTASVETVLLVKEVKKKGGDHVLKWFSFD